MFFTLEKTLIHLNLFIEYFTISSSSWHSKLSRMSSLLVSCSSSDSIPFFEFFKTILPLLNYKINQNGSKKLPSNIKSWLGPIFIFCFFRPLFLCKFYDFSIYCFLNSLNNYMTKILLLLKDFS